jgi:hypothetical protein
MEKIKDKILACFYENTLVKILPINPLQTACCGIQEPAYDSVNCQSRRRVMSVLAFNPPSKIAIIDDFFIDIVSILFHFRS